MSSPYPSTVPMTPVVKKLIIANVAIWVLGVLILGLVTGNREQVFMTVGLVPSVLMTKFYVWQVFTYMFVHSAGTFHILFNMLSLWWFGADLEQRWGARFFLSYYLTCGVGAGLIYLLGTVAYYLITGHVGPLGIPLVGASGAVYGLLLAYGLLFGERVITFMMLFPMKAKYFVMIIGAVELVTMLDSGSGSDTANLAHLGGIVIGFIYLSVVARWRLNGKPTAAAKRARSKLKLVVNNDADTPKTSDGEPKYWN